MKNLKKKRIIIGISLLTLGGLGSLSFVESYFEISKNLDIFASVYREINTYYVDETKPGKLVKTGIDAMLTSLDPYTNYIPEADIEDYRFITTGEYGGVGALIRTVDDHVIIAEPYENSPVVKAGLQAGDIILEVNGKSTKGKTSSQLSEILRGQAGNAVKLKIKRPLTGEEFETEVVREEIKVDDVPYYGMLNDEVGYITLTSFTQTASKSVQEAYNDLISQGMKKLIFDLRGNGGGLLREAVNITNFFVPKGQVVVETKGRSKEWDRTHRTINSPLDLDIDLAVLIDERSASASEIVAGTLQDLDRAVIIGQTSFGKGLVQQTFPLSYNAQLKATVAKYYTPSGRCIQRIDYSHKDEKGKAHEIPDSLTTKYETDGGRIVKDGAGIMPDIYVDEEQSSDLLRILVGENILFDYATQYRNDHDSISGAREFHLSEVEYNAFVDFALNNDFEYTNSSKERLKDLKEVIEEDEFWTEVEAEFEALNQKLERSKEEDLQKFRKEISYILENEIISRYYYRKGRVEASLASDHNVEKALETLGNKSKYSSVLSGTCEECLVKKG